MARNYVTLVAGTLDLETTGQAIAFSDSSASNETGRCFFDEDFDPFSTVY
jgi:hypothetical protein